MSTEEFAPPPPPALPPDLNTLQADYQILTELRGSANSRTYLARHLKLNRDVTITVTRIGEGEDRNTLTLFAADARTLTVMRHRNIIPVIEGRWISNDAFAIVRARVRGATLDHLVDAEGPMPAARVGTTLQQVHAAIEWARDNGIVHRHVAADAIVFQQGSGRVLIELDPSSVAAGVPDACDDARTIGRLAYEMLSGHRDGAVTTRALADARPDLAPEIVRETNALMNCGRDASSRDARAFIALLGGKPEPVAGAIRQSRQSAPVPVVVPAGPLDSAVVVVRQGFGFNARVISAVAVAVLIAVMGAFVLNRRDSSDRVMASRKLPIDTATAAGDVALPAPRQPATPTPAMPIPTPTDSPPRMVPPDTRRPEPPRGNPPAILTPGPVDSLSGDAACESPSSGNQHTCLRDAIDRQDAELNDVYRRLIAAMRREANVEVGDPDPSSVTELRATEKRWVESRDAACRPVGERPFYARARAQCFADQSARRTRELEQLLAAIP